MREIDELSAGCSAGIWVISEEPSPAGRAIARFLEKFPTGGPNWGFASINGPTRNINGVSLHRMPILFHQEDILTIVKRQDCDDWVTFNNEKIIKDFA